MQLLEFDGICIAVAAVLSRFGAQFVGFGVVFAGAFSLGFRLVEDCCPIGIDVQLKTAVDAPALGVGFRCDFAGFRTRCGVAGVRCVSGVFRVGGVESAECSHGRAHGDQAWVEGGVDFVPVEVSVDELVADLPGDACAVCAEPADRAADGVADDSVGQFR
ncbi:hypothetical protein ACQP1G_16635 [Nocardia sp. CA-107356]|uniref:hypothetical protein n=1 Tax=Nocardia sp. CA-107356 TaxID=3239972 RepID=UPI003D946D14